MSAGSVRGVKIDGIPFNVAADANISLNPRIEKESIPHSSGNMTKRTFAAAMAESVKLILTPAEYANLVSLNDGQGNIPMSYEMADGSSIKSEGEVMLSTYQTDDSSCEATFLTSTGNWEIFSAS